MFFTDVVELGPTDFLEILKQARVNARASTHARAHAHAVRQPVAARCSGAHHGCAGTAIAALGDAAATRRRRGLRVVGLGVQVHVGQAGLDVLAHAEAQHAQRVR